MDEWRGGGGLPHLALSTWDGLYQPAGLTSLEKSRAYLACGSCVVLNTSYITSNKQQAQAQAQAQGGSSSETINI